MTFKTVGDPKYGRVLLIGIDGLDPRVLSSLMAKGKLPNFLSDE